jgi:hypothetical protein
MLVVRHGVTRTVILTRRWAVKVPSWRGGSVGGIRGRLQSLAWGLLANQSEYEWHTFGAWSGKVAPVRRSWLWGVVQVYPRCDPLPVDELGNYGGDLPDLDPDPGDHKPDNYGVLAGRVVRIDYDMR